MEAKSAVMLWNSPRVDVNEVIVRLTAANM